MSFEQTFCKDICFIILDLLVDAAESNIGDFMTKNNKDNLSFHDEKHDDFSTRRNTKYGIFNSTTDIIMREIKNFVIDKRCNYVKNFALTCKYFYDIFTKYIDSYFDKKRYFYCDFHDIKGENHILFEAKRELIFRVRPAENQPIKSSMMIYTCENNVVYVSRSSYTGNLCEINQNNNSISIIYDKGGSIEYRLELYEFNNGPPTIMCSGGSRRILITCENNKYQFWEGPSDEEEIGYIYTRKYNSIQPENKELFMKFIGNYNKKYYRFYNLLDKIYTEKINNSKQKPT